LTVALIDGYALSDASQRRGIGTFLRHLVGGLAAQSGLSVSVLAADAAALPDGVDRVPLWRPGPDRVSALAHDLLLSRQLRPGACDVFHSPAQHPPRRSGVPWVQTLHDLTPLRWPDPVMARERRRWKAVGPRLRGASAVAAVSRFSADEAVRLLDLDARRLSVIPHGVDPEVFHPTGGRGLPADPPYLLYVAAWGPHKGLDEALAVIGRLADRGLPHRLVLAGPLEGWMRTPVQAAIQRSPRPDRVDLAGYVEDLPATYRGADVLLMTSRSEGFGLPVLEAMACGTPVVAFDNTALPEVVGDAGVLVRDGDVDALAEAVGDLLRSGSRRAELVAAGLERAGQFRWEDTVEAYRQLLVSAR
jgi:glycosyltransferase involved in cell wall biosynthesis